MRRAVANEVRVVRADGGAARRFSRQRGNAGVTALEFAVLAPTFLLVLFAVFSASLDAFYQLLLDDATIVAARQIQIAGPASTSAAKFVAAVCQELSLAAPNCSGAVSYNVQTNTPPANFASLTPLSMPSNGALPNGFPGSFPALNNVLVQVGYPLPFSFPFIGKMFTLTQTNSILSTTTVRMEPYG